MGAKASGQPTRAPGLDRSGGADMGEHRRELQALSVLNQEADRPISRSLVPNLTLEQKKPQYTDAQSRWRLA